ncbi:hypothetical protein RRG08_061619, partial [Elysia crispata]
ASTLYAITVGVTATPGPAGGLESERVFRTAVTDVDVIDVNEAVEAVST